ncbi:hypothetical protein ACOMHN_013262 [Nucella lapillus]
MSRSRLCVENPRNPCRQGCSGQGHQTNPCDGGLCCVPEVWSVWGAWGACPVTCGGGLSVRSRTCIMSNAQPCGRGCPGPNVNARDCGNQDCCTWSRWSEWTGCPVTCSMASVDRVRTRSCLTPDRRRCPRPGQCPGSSQQRDPCRLSPCEPREFF